MRLFSIDYVATFTAWALVYGRTFSARLKRDIVALISFKPLSARMRERF
jgi:hypothetical protein